MLTLTRLWLYCTKHFTYTNLFNPQNDNMRQILIIILILQVSQATSKWQNWGSNTGRLAPEAECYGDAHPVCRSSLWQESYSRTEYSKC